MANTATKTGSDTIEIVNTAPLVLYLRIRELNEKTVSSSKEVKKILDELKLIKGKIIEGKPLAISIKNLGASDNIDEAIDNLAEEKQSDNTSVVDKAKIDELLAEYEEYIENGLSEKEALYRIKKENEENISAKEIERLIQRQSEIYQTKIKEIEKDFVPEDEDEEIIESKSDEVAQKIIKELSNNNERVGELINRKRTEVEDELRKTVKKVFSGEETTLENGIIKIIQEKDDSLTKQKIPISSSSIKTIQLELNNWVNKNEKQVIEYKGKVLEKKIKTEILRKNSELTKEEKVGVENYAKFVKNFYCSTKTVDINRDKEKTVSQAENVGLSPGQVSNGWDNLQAFTGLINSTQKPLELINQYRTLAGKIGNKIPTGIKECDSLNVVIKMAEKSDKFRYLIGKTQNILNWKGNLFSSIASNFGLDKFVANVAGKVLGEEFVKNSLVILSQKSLEQGSFIILQSFIGGGIPALAVTAATITMEAATMAATAATAALEAATVSFQLANAAATAAIGTAAEVSTAATLATATTTLATATETAATTAATATAAKAALTVATEAAGPVAAKIGTMAATGMVPVIGWILTAVMAISAIFKPAFDKVKNFLSDIGLNFTKGIKKFLEENLGFVGKIGSFVINLAEDIIIMAGTALAAVTVGPIILIFFLVFGGLFGYSTYQSSYISSLVPPKGSNNTEQIVTLPGEPLPPGEPLSPGDDSVAESCPSGWPAKSGSITQGPLGTASHDGQQAIDMVINDRRVYSTSTGIARIKIEETGCGHQVNITSNCNGQTIVMVYCHLFIIDVTQGQKVNKGQPIGIEGTTGSSTGLHLHYELWWPKSFLINDYLPVKVPQFCYRCISF